VATANTRFAILGAGAIGSIIGAHLARAGHAVVMLARGQRAEDIERRGLVIRGLEEFSVRVPVCADPSRFEGADVFIVATKAHGTEAALEPLRQAKIGVAFSIQNGLMKNGQLRAVWGPERVLGALADTSGELLSSGEVLFTRNSCLYVGEFPGGPRASAQQIALDLDAAGIRSAHAPDIESLEWSKFAAWAPLMTLCVATRASTSHFLIDPDLALIAARMIREMGILARLHGIDLSDRSPLPVASIVRAGEDEAAALIQEAGRRLKQVAPTHRMSTLQDLEAGRPLEVEETLGYAVREAARLNAPLPLLSIFYGLIRGIDRIRA
jgi:2-dehydropantoate 2-reductase